VVAFRISRALYDEAHADLLGGVEHVGFFLADLDPPTHTFLVREWRSVPATGFEYQSAFHVTLTDEMKTEAIRWAWQARASLIEAHSHGDLLLPEFSPSDVRGLRDWVPHLFWRLRRRPYAAIVTAGDEFDGLAWISGPDQPEQVEQIEIDDGSILVASRRTLATATSHGYTDGDGAEA
jgi:hypothetical protein